MKLAAAALFLFALTPAQERGRQIYLTGASSAGTAITASTGAEPFAASIVPCASCHGEDGRGRAEGGVRPADITADALSRSLTLNGRTRPPYTPTSLKRALTLGYDSGRNVLHAVMPRYQMTQEDIASLVAYMEILGNEPQPGVTDDVLRIAVIGSEPLTSDLTLYGRKIELHHGRTADAFVVIDASPDPSASLALAERDRIPTIVVQSSSGVSGRFSFSLTAPIEDQRAALQTYARALSSPVVLLTAEEAAHYDIATIPSGHRVIVASPLPPSADGARIALAMTTSLLAQLGRNVTRESFVEALERTYKLQVPGLPPLTFDANRHTATRAAWLMTLDTASQRVVGEPGWVEGDDDRTPARCSNRDFSIGASHMTNTIREPFAARELRGRFVPDFTDDTTLEWIADDHEFRFQINGPDGFSLQVPVARDGSFRVEGLRPGRYCFRTSSSLFQGHAGVIVIDPDAEDAPIEIGVMLGA